ncbi:fumarylacetoacetate hydrolase family protein (plasmid) [Embleya sp. NBC_00888]|uniref:fumarylacetoacetate hydrolase family protein n=1 Tax=Embleya sp. NBC_00888 TaxID=2975960 RepID=UPI002F90FB70|nr:fumarylacetoacetate hydrolase family protein [Embleya sp. NBC_00888]
MRLATVEYEGRPMAVVERDGGLYRLDGPGDGTLGALVAAGPEALRDAALGATEEIEAGRRLAPLRPGKIVAIGLNYLDHIREAGVRPPESPLVFAKFPSSVIGTGEAIVIDAELTGNVDWEVELGVVIGRTLRHADKDEAMAAIAGYTVANDVSARDLQFADGQWVRGKSLDTFCPLGPVLVTPDEIADPQALVLRTRVNGETVQDSSTAEMVFGVAELLSYCSRAFTLEPGDLVLTGTPWGCGAFMDPPRRLVPGDVLETEVEGIGVLVNPVVDADASPGRR